MKTKEQSPVQTYELWPLGDKGTCNICAAAGKRRASFPTNEKYKDTLKAHMEKHGVKVQ